MLKFILKILVIFIIGMLGGIFANQIFPSRFLIKNEKKPIYLKEEKKIYIQENNALKNAIEKVEKTLVAVESKTKTGKTLRGSGIILTSDGLVISLAELAPLGAKINLFWEGKLVSFQILKRDLKENLILIKIEEKNLATTSFGDLEKIKLGERVFLIGTLFEKEKGFKKTVNEGIIKNFSENLIETNIFEKENLTGSPLFDIEGNFLGLNLINQEGRIISIPISKIKSFTGL